MENNAIIKIVTGFLDTVNDPLVGTNVSSGTGASQYAGQLGKYLELDNEAAAALGKNNTLYGGRYRYVQFKSGSTASNARGQLVFYATASDETNGIVTPDATAATSGRVAGVTLNAVDKGNYGFIQDDGLASVLFKASIADTTDGDVAVQSGTTNTADAVADATGTLTYGLIKKIIGVCAEAGASSTISRVRLRLSQSFV